MNKPPERIRVINTAEGLIVSGNNFLFSGDTEHFYTLEKEPMEKKTENLTVQEAWAAMARGECVSTSLCVHRINGLFLEWYDNNGDGSKWESASNLEPGPYSIVPDPSKPKEVEDEYEAEKERLLDDFNNTNSFKMATKSLIEFMERNFARKP